MSQVWLISKTFAPGPTLQDAGVQSGPRRSTTLVTHVMLATRSDEMTQLVMPQWLVSTR